MSRRSTIFLFALLFIFFGCADWLQGQTAQSSMVIGTMITRPNALLVLNPPNGDQGLLLPQITSANRLAIQPSSPADDGLVVFDITEKSFYHWNTNVWVKGLGSSDLQSLSYNASTFQLSLLNGNSVDLSALKELPSPVGQAGKYITTDGTNLTWATISSLGDITSITAGPGINGGGTSGDISLSIKTDNSTISLNPSGELQVVDASVGLAKIQPGITSTVLTTNAAGQVQWAAAPDDQKLSLAGNSMSITNGTTVDLSTLTTSGQITGPISNLVIADNAVTNLKIANGIAHTKLTASATNGQVLTSVGGAVAWTNLPSSVTSIATGSGLSGGPITSTGTLSLASSGVTAGTYGNANQVAQLVVDPFGRITNAGNVTITGAAPTGLAGGDLTGNFPNPTIAAGSGNNIVSAVNTATTTTTINTNRLNPTVVLDAENPAAGDVSGSFGSGLLLGAGSVTAAKLATNSVIDTKIAANAVTDAKIASGITISKLSPSSTNGQVLTTVAGATAWAALPSSVTSVNAGTGLNGGTITSTGTIALAPSGVSAGSFGSSTQVPQLSVDTYGRITSVSNVTITGAAPTGVAGGDLAGNFPNPTIAATAGNDVVSSINNASTTGTINTNKLNPAVVLDTESPAAADISGTYTAGFTIGAGKVGDVNLANGISVNKLVPSTIDAQVLTTIGTSVGWRTPTTGTVTSIIAGSGLTGGTITSAGTVALAPSGVGAGTFGTSTQVPQIAVDTYGRITGVSNITITGAAPTGAAGGDLTGNFPNPTIAAAAGNDIVTSINSGSTTGTINTSKLNPAVVLDSESPAPGDFSGTFATGFTIGNGKVQDVQLASGISVDKLVHSTIDAQVLTTIGTSVGWRTPTTGTVTSVSAGSGLSGGPITSTGALSLANTSVTAGSYGNSTSVAQFTVDAQGRLQSAANVSIASAPPSGAASGDLAGSYPAPTIASGAGPDIATAINNTAAAASISGAKVNANFGSQTITTNGAVSVTGSGTMNIAGASTLVGPVTMSNGVSITGTVYIPGLGGGTNMVIVTPSGYLTIQPIPPVITQGNLTSSTPALSVSGGTNAIIGPGVSLSIQSATNAQTGVLTGTDFTTFNNKVGPTTSATGDVTGNFSTGLVVDALQGINVSTTNPTDQQVLLYNAGASKWEPATVAGVSTPVAFKVKQNIPQFALVASNPNQVIFDTFDYNIGGAFTSNHFHAPAAGVYHFDVIVTVQDLDKQDVLTLYLRNGASANIQISMATSGQNDGDTSATISTDYQAAGPEDITVWFSITRVPKQTIGNIAQTQFSGRRVY